MKVVLENDTKACSVSQSTTVRDSGDEDAAEQNETSNCFSLFCVRKSENPWPKTSRINTQALTQTVFSTLIMIKSSLKLFCFNDLKNNSEQMC